MSLTLDKQNRYRDRYAQSHPGWMPATARYEHLIRAHLATITPPARLLDMGCGRGGVLEQLTDLALDSVGIDPDWLSLHEHRQPVLPRAVATAEAIPLPDNSQDIVISAWVLEHLPQPQRTFNEVSRVLKPGGVFIFMAPNKNSPIALLNRTLKPLQNRLVPLLYGRADDDTFPVMYRASTRRQLETLAQHSGMSLEDFFHIEDPTYLAFHEVLFRLNVLLVRLLPRSASEHLVGCCRKHAN